MTVLAPKYTTVAGRILVVMIMFTAVAVGGWVYLYTQIATAGYDVKQLENNVLGERTTNAELKEKLYGYLNPSNLDEFMAERNLVRDAYPKFVSVVRP